VFSSNILKKTLNIFNFIFARGDSFDDEKSFLPFNELNLFKKIVSSLYRKMAPLVKI
jgi:hypothetical protein